MSPALLREAVRSLRSRRGPTLAAVGGLCVAMAATLVVALIALALTTPDPVIPDPDRVVLLDMKGNPPGLPSPWFAASPVSFATMLKERQVPLDLISRVSGSSLDINIAGRLQPVPLVIADPDLVPLLGLKALHGDLHRTLIQHDGIAISADLSRKLWGELPPERALGRRIQASGRFYTVAAVIPTIDPRSPLSEEVSPTVGGAVAMVGYETPGNAMSEEERQAIFVINGRVFARLPADVPCSAVGGWMREAFMSNPLYAQLPAEWKAGREAAYFRGITLKELPFEGAANELRWQLLSAVASASALLLFMAAFNCMNLQAATLLQRQRETALRRSLGANGRQLLRLWGTEVLLSVLAAAAGAVLLAWWIAPLVATWLGLRPQYPVADSIPLPVLLGLAIAILAVLVVTLALPAWMALRRAPAPALQGRTASEGPWGRRIRQVLLAIQLGGVVLLLSLAGVLAMQQRYLLNADRGFSTHNRLWFGVMGDSEAVRHLDAFISALARQPAVTHWAFSSSRPARDTQGQLELHVSASQHKQLLRVTTVSPGFFDTYGMTVLAGAPTVTSGEATVVIDEKAARSLGFATPQSALGEMLRGGGAFLQEGDALRRIVAVVKSVKMESARDPALPQAFLLSNEPQWSLSVCGPDVESLRQTLERLWTAYGPPARYEIQSADEQRASIYRQEQRLTTMLAAVALLSVGVAMLGAYALVADALRRRRTELVLRRLHGAGHAAIIRELAREFTPPFIFAIFLGLPLALWLGERYLAGFVDRVEAGIGIALPTLLAAIATLVITALATLQHVQRALAVQALEAMD